MSERIVRIIESMYVNTKAKYTLGDIESDWVRSVKGVRQGCILSPLLFGLYTEELTVRVKQTGCGMIIGNERLAILLYADDVVLLSENGEELQEMLNTVSKYGRDFQVKFSVDKSKVMVINGGMEDDGRVWELGGNILKRTKEYVYLGINLSEDGCEKAKSEKIAKANQWLGRLASVAKFRANKYTVCRELWKGLAVPSIMYGVNVLTWNDSEVQKLDVIQNKLGRVALGANGYAGVEAVRGDMGWSLFYERCMKGKLLYKIRIDKMEEDRWVKKIHLVIGSQSKWMKMCKRAGKKCTLLLKEFNREVGLGREWRITSENRENEDWSMNKWVKTIDKKVREYGLKQWKVGMQTKSTLEWYRRKECPKCEWWYDGSWGGELLFKARSQSLEVNARTYRWNESKSKECDMCACGMDETVYHVIVECESYMEERSELMQVVKRELGEEVFIGWSDNEVEGMSVLLGIVENANCKVIVSMKKFLVSVWSRRLMKGTAELMSGRREHAYNSVE